ncbi:Casein kinase 1-like protein [Actinidia chinensis var. chinensis]|uniref:Casein kinase 1-like protein n=1 Tax=Actinidia chinensis var. chinensis TaxID=1590841 RepID=A0A2R6PEM4_ACTCC|nr:Casein kinase 1-like protein [Actinidia chinensis var. chinensis]
MISQYKTEMTRIERSSSIFQSDTFQCTKSHHVYFLMERNSKLRSGSSRLVNAVRVKDDDFGSTPSWIFCVLDKRPALEASRLERTSLGSPDEAVGLLAEMARFEELPFREVWPFSESNSCKCKTFFLV